MKNALKLFGIIALAALIGLSMTACGGDGDGGGGNDFNDVLAALTSGDPPLTTPWGIQPSDWAAIKSAAGGTYRGYYNDEGDILVFFTGASKGGYNAVKTLAENKGMEINMAEQANSTLAAIEYKNPGGGSVPGFLLVYSGGASHPSLLDGIYLPSGTLYMEFDPNI